jgi:Holliday junction resolvase
LLKTPPKKPKGIDFPAKNGVYLIYEMKKSTKSTIYVGQGNIKGRIADSYLLRSTAHPSLFRKKLMKCKKFSRIEDTKDWIEKNCRFAFDDEVKDRDMRILVESLLIAFLRAKGEPLLNK